MKAILIGVKKIQPIIHSEFRRSWLVVFYPCSLPPNLVSKIDFLNMHHKPNFLASVLYYYF
jgi:hypothetical protein